MIKKSADDIVEDIVDTKLKTEFILDKYLDEYADYGMDDIANDLITATAILETVRLKLQYAKVKEND
ncbi:MAG: hypothetical protein IKQ56_01505 [Lachnospiraceae bacterium]|nr:hypothetical protein [Lachnospiraceae bacterium]